ncbi:competence/damage-inducible protein A [Myroides phaeus]|uniref:competence/damage-inducible protein A n=1 Tax=Myroides phaeus TaxID=702745 RepID=UPI001303B1FD|nr:competence/damage-inducible protein A [Myroides phaeus]
MKASIVTIGDEILIGQIVDTNSAYLAKELDKLGFDVIEIITVSDKREAIEAVLQRQLSIVDLVIITGGLGPTKDDVTKNVFCDFFGDRLIEDESVLNHVSEMLERLFKRPLSPINRQQALVPSKAKVLFNKVGTAPGMLMSKENTTFISLPGVPFEMKTIFVDEVVPFVEKTFQKSFNFHKTIITYGLGESLLAELLEEWEDNLPQNVKLAYLPSAGSVRLRLSIQGDSKVFLEQVIDNQLKALPESVIPYVRAYEDLSLGEIVIRELENREKTISFAESCTGGKLSTMFNEKPGSSSYFKGGIVTYSTQSKIDLLGVNQATIDKYSVVSEKVAIEMATKAKERFKSDYAIATTGNAGPSKGDSPEEIGTVYIGIATPEKVFAKKYQFGQPREKVINSAVSKGLDLIYNEILEK